MKRRTFESVLAGGLTVVAAVGLGLLIAVVFGRPRSLRLAAAVVAVVALLAAVVHRRIDPIPFRLGAVTVGVLALAAELFSTNPGIGWLQITVLGSAAAIGLVGPEPLKRLRHPLPRWVVAGGFVLVAGALIRIVIGGGGFGHDEAAYLIKARAWLESTPATGWDVHRGIAQSVLAAAVLPFTRSEVAYRSISIVLTLGTIFAVGWLGRSVRSSRVGVLAAAAFAVAPSLLRRGAEFLTDVPSTGLLVAVTALVWRWSQCGSRWNLRWAGSLAAIAFYVRYQSVLSLGLVVLTVAFLYWDRVRRSLRDVIEVAVLFLLLLTPHFVWATLSVGTPWGVLTETGGAGGRAYLGEGIVNYVSDFPDLLAGQVGALAIVIGLVWFGWKMAAAVRAGSLGPDGRLAVFLLVPALGQILLLGLVAHGEPRFVFFPVALLMVSASIAIDDARKRLPKVPFRIASATTAVALVAMLGVSTDRMDANAEARADSTEVLVDVAETAGTESTGGCTVVTTYGPQITWYSGCQTFTYVQFARQPERVVQPAYVVLFESGKRQPVGAELDAILAETEGEPIVLDDGADALGDAAMWRVRP